MEAKYSVSQYGGIQQHLVDKVISTFDEVTVWCTRSHQGYPVTWITRRDAHPDDEDDNAYGLWLMIHGKYQHAEAVGLLHFLHGQGYTVVKPDPEDADDVVRSDDTSILNARNEDAQLLAVQTQMGLEFNKVCNLALRGKLVE